MQTTLSPYQIRDDRLYRPAHHALGHALRARRQDALDIFHKNGRADSDPSSPVLRDNGAAVTYDFERHLVRVANDPYVNLSNNHMVRVAAGVRF